MAINSDSSTPTLLRDVRRIGDVYGMGFNLGYNGNTVALEYKTGTKYYMPTTHFFDLKLQAASQLMPFLGQKYSNKEFQANLKFFCLNVSEDPYGYPLFHCENKYFTPSQLLSNMFSYLNKSSTSYQNNDSCVSWCVGIPLYYTDSQRRFVLDAASRAGLNSVLLMHELTATALAYKVSIVDLPKYDKLNVAFVDIGATSMQVCIVEFTKEGLKVLSQTFDVTLGGRNFDRVLYDHFLAKCREEYGTEVHESTWFHTRLYDACEKMKQELSVNTESFSDIKFINPGMDSVTCLYMNKEEFVRMSAPLLERVTGPIERALSDAGLAVEDIHCVENVGLGSRIPEIMKIITNFFGKEPREIMEGKKLAAFGCAMKSAELFKTSNIKIQDRFPYSISISWEIEKGASKKRAVVFPRGSLIPCHKDWTFISDRTFHVAFFYTDVDDMHIPTTIGTYKIGPFPSGRLGMVPVKTRVQLNKDGIASIEYAYLELQEKGKEVPLEVSNQYEMKFEGTLSFLNAEVEQRIQIKAELAKGTTDHFKQHQNIMLNKIKWGARHEIKPKGINMDFTDIPSDFNATKNLESRKTECRTKADEELAKTRRELEKKEKLHEIMINEIKNEMYKESHFRQKAQDELLQLKKLYDENLSEKEMVKDENGVLKSESGALKITNEIVKAENEVLKSESEMLKVMNEIVIAENIVLKFESEVLKVANEMVKEENEEFKSESEVLNVANEMVKAENGVLKSERELSKVANEMIMIENEELKKEIEMLKIANGLVKSENEVLKSDSEVFKAALEMFKEETIVLKSQSEVLKVAHEMVKEENIVLISQSEVLKVANKMVKTENEVLKSESEVLKLKNEKIKAENRRLKAKNGALKFENTELKGENENIVKQFEEFRQTILEPSSCSIGMVNFSEFTYLEIEAATNNFDQEFKIGEGRYGCVYKAFLHCKTVAIKIIKPECRQGEEEFNHEVEILSRIRHPNIVPLIGACAEAFALVYEFIPNGSLEDHLNRRKNKETLSWKTRISIASNICSALIFLHSSKLHGVVHCDIKPANILLDSNYQAKITDIGLSRHSSLTSTTTTPRHYTDSPIGTLPYKDPRYLLSDELILQFDVYSFGIILLQLVTGKEVNAVRIEVEEAIKKGRLDKLVHPSGRWSLEEAKRLALLGLWCSQLKRINQPDLEEVWSVIESMNHVGSGHYLKQSVQS